MLGSISSIPVWLEGYSGIVVHSWTAVIQPDIFEVGNFRDFLKLSHGRDLEMNC